jgi:hypothetical protein
MPLLAMSLLIFFLQSFAVILIPTWAAPAAAESREDLYRKCRQAIFRKYGQPGAQYNRRPGSLVLPSQFVIAAIDQCVANGGREG